MPGGGGIGQNPVHYDYKYSYSLSAVAYPSLRIVLS